MLRDRIRKLEALAARLGGLAEDEAQARESRRQFVEEAQEIAKVLRTVNKEKYAELAEYLENVARKVMEQESNREARIAVAEETFRRFPEHANELVDLIFDCKNPEGCEICAERSH
jgi:hypothetical protein